MAKVQGRIEAKVRAELTPLHLEVINESHMHNVPAGSESHFRLVIVTDRFRGKAALERHREVHRILEQELAGEIHALALTTMTPEEWTADGGKVPSSPPCLGGDQTAGGDTGSGIS